MTSCFFFLFSFSFVATLAFFFPLSFVSRYREVHDFLHVLTGLNVSVEAEVLPLNNALIEPA